MGLAIKNTKKLERPWIHAFLCGDTGSGKTTAAATFPNPLFLVPRCENSVDTLMGRSIDYDDSIASMQDMNDKISELIKRHERMKALLAKSKTEGDAFEKEAYEVFPWETIVCESMSHYSEMVVDDVSNCGQKMMDQRGWGIVSNHLRSIHLRLSQLDCHIVYTSLVKIDDAGVGMPLMPGKAAKIIPSACGIIAYCEVIPGRKDKAPTYRMHFRPTNRVGARSRYAGTPDFIDDFNFAALPFAS